MLSSAKVQPVAVVDYDPAWPQHFEFLRKRIAGTIGDLAAAIEHVGSTAVPNLAAKPIIDIDVLLKSDEGLPVAIERLAVLGYVYRGDLGVPGREAFLAPAQDLQHHLYICPPRSAEFRRHVAFRNFLRAHPEEAKIYGDLKLVLAERFRDDRPAYVTAKSKFVNQLTSVAIRDSQEGS